MKFAPPIFLALVCIALFCNVAMVCAEGPLTPPTTAFDGEGKPQPFMRSLNDIEPRFPISEIPCTITNPGAYFLTKNLTAAPGQNGIIVSAMFVDIDMNGFFLSGTNGSQYGVYATTGTYNTTVHDGVFLGWEDWAINLTNSENSSAKSVFTVFCENGIWLTYEGTAEDCMIIATEGCGIRVGPESNVRDSTVRFAADGIIAGKRSRVTECNVTACTNVGVTVGHQSSVRHCMVENCAVAAIYLAGDSCIAVDNTIGANDPEGIGILADSGGAVVKDNHIVGMNTGIASSGAMSRLEDNHITHCGVNGISTTNGNSLVIRNSVGNCPTNYNIGPYTLHGPILSNTTALITNTSPWANFVQ